MDTIDLSRYTTYIRRLTPAEGGGFLAYIQELPGCISDGETIIEAFESLQDLLELYIEVCLEDNCPFVRYGKTKEPRYVYDYHLGGLYISDELIDYSNLYCSQCGDSDYLLGEFTTKTELARIVLEKDLFFCKDYLKKFIYEAFQDIDQEVDLVQETIVSHSKWIDEALSMFPDSKGLTYEEAKTVEGAYKKLFKPTGRNIFGLL